MQKTLIIGATSAIAESVAKIFAEEGHCLYLLARNQERLRALVSDLEIRGAALVLSDTLDMNNLDAHENVLNNAMNALDGVDIVLIAHGTLPNQTSCENSVSTTLKHINTNLISNISILTHLASRFEKQKSGVIAVISSVAGDRGRQSNYVYGTAKGGLSIFLQGLRNRLHSSGVCVLTIKPGFVDSPMTSDMKKNLLWAKPDAVAKEIVKAIALRKDFAYTPKFWWLVMFMIKIIPERIFKALHL